MTTTPDLSERLIAEIEPMMYAQDADRVVDAALAVLAPALADARREERERCAAWHVEQAEFCRYIAETTIRDWISPDNSPEDNAANRQDAREHRELARWHDSCAAAIRALSDESPSAGDR